MSDIALKVENVSKLYQLGQIGTGTISRDIERWWAKTRGKEDPFAKVGQVNDRTRKANSDAVWALKDINFEVKKGEVLGIIGRNGAGKSTLLKILSKVTAPSTGKIYLNGRIASLLEVGTGFHPEMTGRENIFMNGAVLGMRKWEIKRKFDEIVDFAGVEAYIDTPVKRYSSGMYVRLAFAVAAYLEPEILIVDEVLAVGDAEFQKKCLGRMKDVSVNDGRTVLFVSHNMAAVSNICQCGLLLKNGTLDFQGPVADVIDRYLKLNSELSKKDFEPDTERNLEVLEIRMLDSELRLKDVALSGDDILFELEIINKLNETIVPAIGIYDEYDKPIFLCGANLLRKDFAVGERGKLFLELKHLALVAGEYYLNIELKGSKHSYRHIQRGFNFTVENGDYYKTGVFPIWGKGVLTDFDWNSKAEN